MLLVKMLFFLFVNIYPFVLLFLIIQLFFFLLALNGILRNNSWQKIAGIAFLGIQIREERDYAIVENTTIVVHGMADWMSSVAHDRDRADIIVR